MKKKTLEKLVNDVKNDTKDALQAVYDALNKGQKSKLMKNEKIIKLFQHYGVEIENE